VLGIKLLKRSLIYSVTLDGNILITATCVHYHLSFQNLRISFRKESLRTFILSHIIIFIICTRECVCVHNIRRTPFSSIAVTTTPTGDRTDRANFTPIPTRKCQCFAHGGGVLRYSTLVGMSRCAGGGADWPFH